MDLSGYNGLFDQYVKYISRLQLIFNNFIKGLQLNIFRMAMGYLYNISS